MPTHSPSDYRLPPLQRHAFANEPATQEPRCSHAPITNTMSTSHDWNTRPGSNESKARPAALTSTNAVARGHGSGPGSIPSLLSSEPDNEDRLHKDKCDRPQPDDGKHLSRSSQDHHRQKGQLPATMIDVELTTRIANGMKERKSRGRPRLAVSDSTAADKRRTQIRVAQRKYRERKETTISELKDEIGELHTLLQKTNSSVKHLYTTLDSTGLLDALPTDHAIQKQLRKLLDRANEITERLGEPVSDEDP